MVTLPVDPQISLLRSMWLVFNGIAALIAIVITLMIVDVVWVVPVVVFFIGTALLGFRWIELQYRFYSAWNRLAVLVCRIGSRWTLYVAHQIFLRSVGSHGSRFATSALAADEAVRSAYTPIDDSSRISTRGVVGAIEEVSAGGWITRFLNWTGRSGYRWALLLVPFLMSISLFEFDRKGSAAPDNIYTLF